MYIYYLSHLFRDEIFSYELNWELAKLKKPVFKISWNLYFCLRLKLHGILCCKDHDVLWGLGAFRFASFSAAWGLRGLTCWEVWDPDTCIFWWANNLRNSLDTCMTAVRQLILESTINFQGARHLAAFQKGQSPKNGRPGSLGFASRFASQWGAKQTVFKSSRQRIEMPANLKMHLAAFIAIWAGRWLLFPWYFYLPVTDLVGYLLKQYHFSHLENHHLPLLPEWGMQK